MKNRDVVIDKSGNITNRKTANKATDSERNNKEGSTSKSETNYENEIEELQCTICLEILNGAVETNCGHAFCGNLVLQLIWKS